MKVAVIGGTGLYQLDGLLNGRQLPAELTPFGEASASVFTGELAGHEVFFLPRHGCEHQLPPHRINYRANLWLLRKLGVEVILAVNAVGAIHPDLAPGALCFPDQLIDYSYGREHTFFDGELNSVQALKALGLQLPCVHHIDFTEPYDASLRELLVQTARHLELQAINGGVYACAQGPRLETAAEVRRMQRDGCDLVGMTGMPEAALAAELGMAYASICLAVNPAAGLSEELITMEAITAVIRTGIKDIARLLEQSLNGLEKI